MLLWSRVGGQLLDHYLTSSYCGQFCFIMLLWSGVGGQLLSHHVAVVRDWWFGGQLFDHHVAVVRGWWSAIGSSCCYGQGLVVSY